MALPFKIRLWHKGAFLISLVLVVELFLMAGLGRLLEEAENEARVATHSENIATAATQLLELYVRIGSNLALYMTLRSSKYEKLVDKARAEVPERFARLKSLVQDQPEAVEIIATLQTSLNACEEELGKAKESIAREEDFDERAVRKKILPHVKNIMEMLRDITAKNQEISNDEIPRQQSRTRNSMKHLILLGIISNVFFAFAMIMFFVRDILRGLNRLEDNSTRLARGQTLHPVMHGADEIANLDRVFHDMAAALDAAAFKTRSIIENMPVGLVGFDPNGIIDTVNPRTEEMFGLSAEELHGRHVVTLFAQSSRSEPDRFMQELQSRCLNRVSEMRAESKDGRLFPVEVSMNEFGGAGGGRYLTSILDITERHEVERLKREFVAMVSHDLRTPLTSVEASLTLLAAGALGEISEEAASTVRIAESEVVRLRSLVNDLLDIAKIEAGKMDMAMDDVQLDEVILQSLNAVRPLASERQVTIESAESDAVAFGDGNRLVQVLVNFLSNAVKYSPDGGTVKVDVSSTSDWHEVRVTDEGPGIDPEYHELIFHRYLQTNSATQKEGTGLGLAIAKTIIEQHGGTIGVDSEPGNGSSFWFRVPVRTAAVGPGIVYDMGLNRSDRIAVDNG